MDEQEQHEMVLETTHPSGAEEWFCPTCGRRFLVCWAPAYSMIILDPGDQFVPHSGSTSSLHIGTHMGTPDKDAELPEELGPWVRGLKDAGLDDWWDQAA